jgi:aspartyl-tRNA(Asn)/glutamyl-tRNA(Gln) amidotransferase subunit A
MEDVTEAPGAAFEGAVRKLRDAGAVIEEIEFAAIRDAMDVSAVLYSGEAYGQWGAVIEANPELMFHEIRQRFELGKTFTAAQFAAAWERLQDIRKAYFALTAGYDAVLLPSSPILPANLHRLETDHDYYVWVNLFALRNTRIGNLMGTCGLTLPTGTPSCGLMMMCAPDTEEAMLRLGAAAEAVLA